jgi:poly(hydroxyalkanoate) granule-associated protein
MTKNTEEKGTFSAIEATAKAAIEQGEKVWLAGLGVLARAQQDGRDWIGADKVKLFDDFVDAGRDFADRAKGSGESQLENTREAIRGAFDKAREQAKSSYVRAVDQTEANVEKIAGKLGIDQIFDRRIERALDRLGYPSSKQFAALNKKVTALTKSAAPKAKAKKARTGATAKKSA